MFDAVHIHPDGDMGGLVAHMGGVFDLDHQRVQIDHRIHRAVSIGRCESWSEGIRMARYAPNKMPAAVKRRYFELIRAGLSGSAAAEQVGVSLSCGSVWFIDAGRVSFIEIPISPRYLSQDDRIEIADGRARGEPVQASVSTFLCKRILELVGLVRFGPGAGRGR